MNSLLEQLTSRQHLFRAFERVNDNGGCRGADGVTLFQFRAELDQQLDRLQSSLLARRYHPLPLLRFAEPKPQGGLRHLCVPTVRDRVAQTAVYLLTQERFEQRLHDSSFAYRPGRSVRQAVERVRELRDQGYRHVVDADIDDFFDSVDHPRLVDRLGELQLPPYANELFRLWIEAEIYDGRSIRRLHRGIPQGSVVSPMLSNLFLDDFDRDLETFDQKSVRYGDDFIVLCRDETAAAATLEPSDYLLDQMELDLDDDKSGTTCFQRGFKFLGVLFVGDEIYQRLGKSKKRQITPQLPPPLDLSSYLELKYATEAEEASWPNRNRIGTGNGSRFGA